MRLFIALPVPPAPKKQFSAAAAGFSFGRPVPPDAYHLTLKFLGNRVDPALLYPISECMAAAAQDAKPFRLLPSGYELLPRDTLAVRLQDPDGELERLYSLLDASLAELGFPSSGKRFLPHVTLGRGFSDPDALPGLKADIFTCNSLLLYESRQENGRVSYAPLHREMIR